MKETLYYDQRTLYNFQTIVTDILGNPGTLNTIVEIEDMPNKEPMWVRAFASARFPEKVPKVKFIFILREASKINFTFLDI